jgi:hypothetical protein
MSWSQAHTVAVGHRRVVSRPEQCMAGAVGTRALRPPSHVIAIHDDFLGEK